jgi:replicative DNA helicase
LNLEDNILSSLGTSEDIEKAWDLGLQAKHFQSPINRAIFEFTLQYWFDSDRQSAPTDDVIHHEFPSFKFTKPKETLSWLVDAIKRQWRDANLVEAIETVADHLSKDQGELALEKMSKMSWEITQAITNRRSLSDMSENADDRLNRYIERATFDGSVRGAPLGLPEIDNHIYGILPSEVAYLVGWTGTGKSWFLANAAISALKAGWTPYLVTLELSRKDIEDRIDCLASGVPYTALTRGELDKEQVDALKRAQEWLGDTGSLFVDHPPMEERTVQSIINRARQRGANYLLLDQLSFIQPRTNRHERRDQVIAEITNDIKTEVSEEESKFLSVVVAAQFNREMAKSGKASLEKIGLSSNIEQVADHAFAIVRTEEMAVNNAMLFQTMKHRRGAPKHWLLNWHLKNYTEISVDRELSESDL